MVRISGRLFVAGCVCVLGALALADDVNLTWHTIDGGGLTQSTAGGFEMSGTVGQPDVSGHSNPAT